MATAAVQNPPTESNTSKKKKARGANGAPTTTTIPAVPEVNGKEDSSMDANGDSSSEHPYIKELAKHIRNTHKKLSGMQKVDAIIAEHPNTSLDDLVAQRKINPDQKAAALKKPQLQQQLAAYEEQVAQYRKIDGDYQVRMQKQKDEITLAHQKEMEKLKEELGEQGKISVVTELRSKLLVLSQFLRFAAAKRSEEGATDTDEGLASEGALLLVYGGDEKGVEACYNLIEGSDDKVPDVSGTPTAVSYSQVRLASISHAPYESEASWVDSVAEATADDDTNGKPTTTDPTIAHAGLTELDTQPNGIPSATPLDSITSPPQADAGDDAGNAAGDRWDTTAAGTQPKSDEETLNIVARPDDEVDVPNPSALPSDALLTERSGNSWADEPTYDNPPAGFTANNTRDVKAAVAGGKAQVDTSWAGASEPTQPLSAGGWAEDAQAAATVGAAAQEDGDGFHQVPGRHRGRGGRGRGADGEFRGRGRGRGGFRGDGEFRGRGGRGGGFRGGRGGEGGEFRGRGRGGRGGPRGGPGGEGGFRGGAEGGPARAADS